MVIDFHTHVFPSFFRKERDLFFSKEPAFEILYSSPKAKIVGINDLLENMDKEAVQKSVIFGFPWHSIDFFRRHNDYIIESVQRHPDRLIGFCCFSPQSPQAPQEIERCLKAGLSGVGEIAMYDSHLSSGDAPALKEIMGICSRYDVPILIHTNEPVGHNYPGKTSMTLRTIYEFLKEYRSNRIILAHWGGGLFFYALMKKDVRQVLRNVWFDTAASPYLYVSDIYRVAGEIIGFEKILFGSDYPLLNPGRYFGEMESAKLKTQSINKICGENAANLLRFPFPPPDF